MPVEVTVRVVRIDFPACQIELIEQRQATVHPVDGHRGIGCDCLEAIRGQNPDIRVGDDHLRRVVFTGIAKDLANAFRTKLGPNGIVGRAEKTTERPRSRGTALRPEAERQAEIPRHRRRF